MGGNAAVRDGRELQPTRNTATGSKTTDHLNKKQNFKETPVKRKILIIVFNLALALGAVRSANAQTAFTYQGKLVDDCCPATGLYDLRLRLYPSAGPGGSPVSGTPTLTQPGVPVTNGLFTASLNFGDAAFNGSRRWLQIEVRTNSTGSYETLAPRTELTPTPYALYAQKAGTVTNNAITGVHVASGQVVKSLNGLRDNVTLSAGANVTLTPSGNNIQIAAPGGTGWGLGGNNISPGQFLGTLNNAPLEIRAPNGVGIGTATPSSSLHLLNPGNSTYLTLEKVSAAYESGLRFTTAGANRWWVYADDTSDDFLIHSGGEVGSAPRIRLPSANNDILLGLNGGNVGIGITSPGAKLHVDGGNAGRAIYAHDVTGEAIVGDSWTGRAVFGYSGSSGTGLHGSSQSGYGVLGENRNTGDYGILGAASGYGVWGQSASPGGRGVAGTATSSAADSIGVKGFHQPSGNYGELGNGSYGVYGRAGNFGSYGVAGEGDNIGVYAHNTSSGKTAYLATSGLAGDFYGDVQVHGTTTTGVLTITGGADLAEPFQMSGEKIAEGSVVVIDEENPGHLKQATRAYDTRVAGIVSGANGVKAGIALHQEGVLEGGQNVALTGRVYVKVDASFGAIKPGDLLTTSDTPGHAMKVTDSTKAQGAILGKAMTALHEGTGMVLVLVSLQ